MQVTQKNQVRTMDLKMIQIYRGLKMKKTEGPISTQLISTVLWTLEPHL